MRFAIALTLLSAVPAVAAVRPCYLDQMVAEAVTVVQVTDHEVSEPDESGYCTLAGTVVRSFRGVIRPGMRVQTSFACDQPHRADENGVVIVEPGGTTWRDAEPIAQAAVVEIHAEAEGGPAGYGWGLLPLDAPTDESAFSFEYIDDPSC